MKFYDFIDSNKDKNITFYFDMDGVLAKYDIYNFDYNTIRPLTSIIEVVKNLIDSNYKVKILSICNNNNNIIDEKLLWMDRNMSFFNKENAIFISKEDEKYKGIDSMVLKSEYLKNETNKNNINVLIDDDNSIIKYIKQNNSDIKLFHISSLI